MNSQQRYYVKRLLQLKQKKLKDNKGRLLETNKSYRRVKSKAGEIKEIDKELILISEIYKELGDNVKNE